MNRDADVLVDVQWLARCANRLRQEWLRADVMSIEEAAVELWGAEWLRAMPGANSGRSPFKHNPPITRSSGAWKTRTT